MNYNIATLPAQFNNYYTFSKTYAMAGRLPSSLVRLLPLLASNNTKQALYRSRFYSGNNSNNAITNANWPVYWGGIGAMTKKDLIATVDTY
jgi:hypothetical protein